MKEELLEEARRLAEKCRESYENIKNKKGTISLECMQDMLINFVQHSWNFIGFCRALCEANIINVEEMKGINKIAFPESYHPLIFETNLSFKIIDSINELKGLDNL